MPVFVYVLLGVALLVLLILTTRVRVFICYENGLTAYARLWFFKFNFFPEKIKASKRKKDKKGSIPALPSTHTPKKEKSITKKLWEMKAVLTRIINIFLGKIHFRFLKIMINVSCDNAAKTALLYAGANQGVAYIIETLRNISNVDVTNNSQVCVNADFVSGNSSFEGKIELYIRVAPLILVGIHALKEYENFKSTKED